jgi:hypothetical protein
MTTLKNLVSGVGLVAAALLSTTLVYAQAPQPESFQRSFTLNSGGTLRVDNYKGTIHVTGSDSNQVVVNVTKRFEGNEADRKIWMEETKIEFKNSSDRVEVEVRYPSESWSCWFCWREHGDFVAEVELEIKAPRHTNIEVESYKPDIRIASLDGDLRIHSYKSPMNIEHTTGAIRIDTYKNEIHLHDVNIRGALTMKSFKANATIEATSLGNSAELETDKGSIVLRVPPDIGLDLDFAGSRRSSFRTDFPVTSQTGWSHEVRGTINQGGTRLRLRTEKGVISLGKLSAQL